MMCASSATQGLLSPLTVLHAQPAQHSRIVKNVNTIMLTHWFAQVVGQTITLWGIDASKVGDREL
jgi:hypothetical protein